MIMIKIGTQKYFKSRNCSKLSRCQNEQKKMPNYYINDNKEMKKGVNKIIT